jgi:hypothetical protein
MGFRPRIAPRIAFWALAGASLLLSHDAVWLVQVGPGEDLAAALRGDQHGYWAWASIALVAAAVAVALHTVLRTLGLVRRARRLRAAPQPLAARTFLRRATAMWIPLFAVVAVGFTVQESVEHLGTHGHVIGLGALTGPEYPLAVPVLVGVTAIGALLAALVGSLEDGLVESIAAVLRLHTRAPRSVPRPMLSGTPPRPSAMASGIAGRAPPALLVAI